MILFFLNGYHNFVCVPRIHEHFVRDDAPKSQVMNRWHDIILQDVANSAPPKNQVSGGETNNSNGFQWLFLVPLKGGISGIVHPPIGRKIPLIYHL